MSASAWRHGARIVAARPFTFAVYLAHYLLFYTLPLATGLILRAVFDALSGRAPAGPNVWSLVALMAAVEVARLVVIYSTVRFGQGFHLGLASLMRGAMLNWLVAGPGARATVGSAGAASGTTSRRWTTSWRRGSTWAARCCSAWARWPSCSASTPPSPPRWSCRWSPLSPSPTG